MQINLSDWASLVQDVAASLQVLPPGLSNCLDTEALNLLQHLEAVTQVKFCCLCYYPETNCRCPGVPLLAPPTSWRQITERTPVYGATASSGGVTTLSTSLGGMSRFMPPPPGISIWDMSPWKASIPQQPARTSGLGVTFDFAASKPAPTDSWDTNVHGRQLSRGRDNDSQPASCPRGGREGSSIRKTSNLKP